LTFATFVAAPENRLALSAVRALADVDLTQGFRRAGFANPLFVHGPPGTGKTHLMSALAEQVIRREPTRVVTILSSAELGARSAEQLTEGESEAQFCTLSSALRAGGCDLLVVEDVQHLSARGRLTLVPIFDELHARGVPLVFTATAGPRRLDLPERLASRLAGGLVVGLEPLGVASRLTVLQDRAQRRQLAVSNAVLAWVAERTSGGRQLEGALLRLEALAKGQRELLDVATVARHFEEETAAKPSVERVAQKVGSYFRVELRLLRSERRGRHILLPRQIGMYLARRLTGLSLEQIGDYFGGRDHSTVLHACRKVEKALDQDALLSGTVRQLYLELA
jgi:chromosomal replication initiator protein